MAEMSRIERAIRKWSKVTDQPIAEWAIDSWLTELDRHTATEEKIIEAMTYLVCAQRKPNLTELTEMLERGVPRDWLDRRAMTDDLKDEGARFMRMIWTALAAHDPFGELLKCIQWGMKEYPHLDWREAEKEARERAERRSYGKAFDTC